MTSAAAFGYFPTLTISGTSMPVACAPALFPGQHHLLVRRMQVAGAAVADEVVAVDSLVAVDAVAMHVEAVDRAAAGGKTEQEGSMTGPNLY